MASQLSIAATGKGHYETGGIENPRTRRGFLTTWGVGSLRTFIKTIEIMKSAVVSHFWNMEKN